MVVRHLGHTDFNDIMASFLYAFENYFVKMPSDYGFYQQRWKAAGVRYDLSYGMFDGDNLVGFILNAVDKRHGEHIAFNTGTGVIPEYRGRKIVRTIYNYAIPDLIQNGITKSTLEVIVENEKAIKAYESVGFKICKTYKCFAGELESIKSGLNLQKLKYDDIPWKQLPNQEKYSWDFHYRSLRNGNAIYYYVYNEHEIESFFSINTSNGTVNQFEVLSHKKGNWQRLMQAIQSVSNKVRIVNVDDRLLEKIAAIAHAGLKNTVNQFEMELPLSS